VHKIDVLSTHNLICQKFAAACQKLLRKSGDKTDLCWKPFVCYTSDLWTHRSN